MKCILMNKNIEVLIAEYNSNLDVFDRIYEVINIDYAPLIIKHKYDESKDGIDLLRPLSDWFKGRGIPSWRDRLDLLLNRLNISSPEELLNKAFGLSLSDQYWIKPEDFDLTYDDINFFDNDFNYAEFLEASFSINSKTIKNESSLKTPNNTTDGMLRKAWIIENGTRYLLKGGYKREVLQPFNEVLAAEICKRLGFDYVEYTLDKYKENIVSKCPCFITKDTELITAYQIRNNMIRHDTTQDYEDYIKVLENNGIIDARIKMENMFILDYLIMNEDRHLNNFGIIRDINTLKWLDVAPIFDNGMSLNVPYYNEEEVIVSNHGKFFYDTANFDDIINIVNDIKRIDISKLDGVVEWFDDLLHEYQKYTNMSDKRIHLLCVLLNRQINKLKNLIEGA